MYICSEWIKCRNDLWTTDNTANADLYGPEEQVVAIRKAVKGFTQFTLSNNKDDGWQLTESDTVISPQETVISNWENE